MSTEEARGGGAGGGWRAGGVRRAGGSRAGDRRAPPAAPAAPAAPARSGDARPLGSAAHVSTSPTASNTYSQPAHSV